MKNRDGQDVDAGRWVGTTTALMSGLRGRRGVVTVLSTVLLTSAAAVTVSAPAEAGSPTNIVYETPAARASAGTPVNVAGAVSPATESRTVYLQQHYSGAWHRVATTRTTRGAFTLPLPTKTAGTFTYRLAVTAGADGASAETRSITFQVITRPEGGNPEAYRFLTSGGTPAEPIARWNPCRDIGYRVNLANSTAGALPDVKAAIAQVSSATGLKFIYRGSTKILPGSGNDLYPTDSDLVIAWAKPGQSEMLPNPPEGDSAAAGQGGGQWGSAQDSKGKPANMITEGYVVLNATMRLSGGFGPGPKYGWNGTRGQLLMHELGHAVGLDHPTIKDKIQIMSPTMSSMPAVWGEGDRNGLRLVGESAGCMSPTALTSTEQD